VTKAKTQSLIIHELPASTVSNFKRLYRSHGMSRQEFITYLLDHYKAPARLQALAKREKAQDALTRPAKSASRPSRDAKKAAS